MTVPTPSDDLPDDLADSAADRLLSVVGTERRVVLEALVAEHPEHAAGLRRLLASLAGADRLLADTYPDPDAATATHIGGHRVVRQLGEGAFGIVFLCAQERPVVRNVAIKVLRPGFGDSRTLRRFAAEQQILASMNHPAITQVFDAGVLADGRPFFVMEYVDGLPMRRYCDERRLPIRERLRVFVELCRGVAHAHGRGIVHRDLKPANVLVVESDTGPLPKIIDFGIAKALLPSDNPDAPRTDPGRAVGTPGYMSPEQAAGRIDEIDERCDVFALGVMLYELLTGQLPWPQGAAVTDTEPMRPSARVTTSADTATPSPLQPPQQKRAAELRGDLDWITLKALARERADRYATAGALADDIERHCKGEPVHAGPPSTWYRTRKFVRRNRAAVTSMIGAVALVGIVVFAAFVYGSSANAAVSDARSDADARFADALAAVERLLVRANDERLQEAPRGNAARQDLLQDAISFYDRFLRSRPTDAALRAKRCSALLSLSNVHFLVGELSNAQRIAAEARVESEALFASDPARIDYCAMLGGALRSEGRAIAFAGRHGEAHEKLAAAATHLMHCAAKEPRAYGQAHAAVLREVANTLPGGLVQDGLVAHRESLRVLEALRTQHPGLVGLEGDLFLARMGLAQILFRISRLEEARDTLTRAEIELPAAGAEHLRLANQFHQLQGAVLWDLEDRPAALKHFQQGTDAAIAWQKEKPDQMLPRQELIKSLRKLGFAQSYVGDWKSSSDSYRAAIAQAEALAKAAPDDPGRLVSLCYMLRNFARTLWDRYCLADLEEAAQCAARARVVDDRIPDTIDAGRQPRWMLLATEAVIADSRGSADADALWGLVEAALPSDEVARSQVDQDLLIEALTGVAGSHFRKARYEAAAAMLVVARERIDACRPDFNKRMVEVGWLEARLAALQGDHVAAAAAAERILLARPTWFGQRRSADALDLAWRGAANAGLDDIARSYRDRAISLYDEVIAEIAEDVAKDPLDVWFTLPWGFASVRRAELADVAGDSAKARTLLALAMPRLVAVQPLSLVDLWEPLVFDAGQQLQGRLASATVGR